MFLTVTLLVRTKRCAACQKVTRPPSMVYLDYAHRMKTIMEENRCMQKL